MLRSIVLLVTASILSTLALGCTGALPAAAFEPRSYAYVPELGPDGPQISQLANPAPQGTEGK
jgi:hypothetical protein